ncbi:MAG: hypothetical protein AVDCRST_MAG40-3479, partial [uncultured Gemmatimonadaceae bacterium]
ARQHLARPLPREAADDLRRRAAGDAGDVAHRAERDQPGAAAGARAAPGADRAAARAAHAALPPRGDEPERARVRVVPRAGHGGADDDVGDPGPDHARRLPDR